MYSRRSRKNIPMAAPRRFSEIFLRGIGGVLLVEQGEEFATVFLHAGMLTTQQVE